MRILVIVHTVSSWGGVQEWALTLIQGLASKGHTVGVIAPTQRLIDEAKEAGARGLRSDLAESDLSECLGWVQESGWDVIVSSPMRSREVSQYLYQKTGIPFVATFHGVYSDYVQSWKDEAGALVAVTGLLAKMVHQIGGVPLEQVAVIPNGVPESELARPGVSFEDKMEEGVLRIAMASRLDIDKLKQLEALDNLVTQLSDQGVERVHATIMGDGSGRGYFNSRLRELSERNSGFTYRLSGWLSLPDMLAELEHSTVSLTAGRTALHSLAVGTPVIGVGAREYVGLFVSSHVDAIADSNFGDYFTPQGFEPTADLSLLLNPGSYAQLAAQGREWVRQGYTAESMIESFENLLARLV